MHLRAAVLFFCASLTVSLFAAAGDVNADDPAIQAFNEGKKHFEDGDYGAAAASFREANRLRPNWKLLYNIGQSEAAAKHYVEALEAFDTYLAQGGDEVPLKRRDEVIDEVERLRMMLGSIQVRGPDGAEVLVDNEDKGETPLKGPLMVVAGLDHEITIKKGEKILSVKTIRLTGGAQMTLIFEEKEVEKAPASAEVETSPEPTTAETAPQPAPKKSNALFITGLTLTGVGAATLIGSVVTGAMALSLNSDLEPLCQESGCPENKKDDEDKLDRLALTTNVLLGVGGAVAVTGIVLTVIAKKKSKESVAILPILSPSVAGGSMTWRF